MQRNVRVSRFDDPGDGSTKASSIVINRLACYGNISIMYSHYKQSCNIDVDRIFGSQIDDDYKQIQEIHTKFKSNINNRCMMNNSDFCKKLSIVLTLEDELQAYIIADVMTNIQYVIACKQRIYATACVEYIIRDIVKLKKLCRHTKLSQKRTVVENRIVVLDNYANDITNKLVEIKALRYYDDSRLMSYCDNCVNYINTCIYYIEQTYIFTYDLLTQYGDSYKVFFTNNTLPSELCDIILEYLPIYSVEFRELQNLE